MATMVDDSIYRVEQKLPNKKQKDDSELHHSFEQSLSEYSVCFTIAFYLALHMVKHKQRLVKAGVQLFKKPMFTTKINDYSGLAV